MKMDAEKYIKMCEALGKEVDYSRMPPSYSEFPWYVKDAITIFNQLPDTYTSGLTPIYIGKDLSALLVLLDVYEIDADYRLLVTKVIQFLDDRAKSQALDKAKKQQQKHKKV